jgi:hypothetical protein
MTVAEWLLLINTVVEVMILSIIVIHWWGKRIDTKRI